MSNASNTPLHFGDSLRLTRASKQYMYDDSNTEYLDCISSTAHVGHCHPLVVTRGQQQMARLVWAQGFLFDALSLYLKELTDMMPEQLSVCYLVNSGSEANDLALRLARSYTRQEDVIVFEGAYHGNLGSVADISPKLFPAAPPENNGRRRHVHVAPLPDTYRGRYRETDPDPGARYAQHVERLLERMESEGRRVAAFMSECLVTQCGMVAPPEDYFRRVYSLVRARGGVCVMDEVATGLGRIGTHTWAFESYGVVPDIVTLGGTLGNGHPMSAVVTRRDIAETLSEYLSTFGGNPVSCAVGLAVLEVMRTEKLMTSATNVGRFLKDSLTQLAGSHGCIGDVRGSGLCLGVEIVSSRQSRKPDPTLARQICFGLREERILATTCGPAANVLQLTPPMCFTMTNARTLLSAVDAVLGRLLRRRAEGGGDSACAGESRADGDSDTDPERLQRQEAKRRRVYEEVD
ncbi:5-phosphohydroxy-L-lysine phospho-lyase-like [Amphibalanus amphitrite]|uniref:5-phosphohydroxy-L-lysine phospho-lyase-like n=1 Tax=Amphibalanus amphitrite TaxID=1232801 RepID=UPI001C92840F|nr:5-phosphohydroxy-L-lysine phospho-lyase-like [Amphibalanus amphitrite]